MDKAIIDALNKALEDFKANIDFELETSKADDSTKDLVEQLARQTYYALDQFADQIKNL